MIVVCTNCQTRFKVADEKIGPRGAKVRCSKCQTVFVVQREVGVVSAEAPPPTPPATRRPGALELDLESAPRAGVRPSGIVADPFARGSGGPAGTEPFSMPGAPGAADPFGAGALAEEPPQGAADPFGAHDPFSAQGGPGGGAAFGSVDPFVATVAGPAPGSPSSAVTDLSDLIGGAPDAPAPSPAPEPSGILDSGFDLVPASTPPPGAEAAPFAGDGAGAPVSDLSLAEPTAARGLPGGGAAPASDASDFGGADLFGHAAGEAGGGFSFGEEGDDAFAAAPDLPEPPPPPAPPTRAAVEPPSPLPQSVAEPEGGSGAAPAQEAAAGLRQRASRIRVVAINAISLVGLLVVVVALLAFWRGARPGVAGGLRPLALLGTAQRASEPFSASRIRSGLYDRPDAAPLLFVTGQAVSAAPASVSGLRVRVELVRKGAVLAQGEARAGAMPSPEELSATRDAAGVAALLDRLAERAPAQVKPGDAVPFLVAISDYPQDGTGVGLTVTVEPLAAVKDAGGTGSP